MKLDGVNIMSIAYSFANKRTYFEFSIPGDITSNLEELQGQKLKLELKRDTHRSLNANRIFVEAFRRATREVKNTKGRHIQAIYI